MRKRGSTFAALLVAAAAASEARADAKQEAEYYKMVTYEPPGLELEVSGLTTLKDGKVMVATRGGEVFVIENAYGAPAEAKFTRYAFGLATPLGLLERDGWIYVGQRGELTRMKDSNGDGRGDLFETVTDRWDISGNYHEYTFGPVVDKAGAMWVTLNKPFGEQPLGRAHWRGWAMRIDPKTGATQPVAVGLRSPAGVESSPTGDVFYTDNQGEWCNASKLSHLAPGEFHGHPWGLPSCGKPEAANVTCPKEVPEGTMMKDLKASIPSFKMPAVWFPYDKLGKSPSGFRWDLTRGKFGPFAGQMFVGDQHHAMVMRVFLEQVNGHWQGAAFRFREGFHCGIVRLAFGQDGSLFAGMTNAGWGGKGTRAHGLQRLVWTGKVPLEVKEMRARPDGFELTFTKPVRRAQLASAAAYAMTSYTYRLRSNYGGPEEDTQTLTVKPGKISNGGRTVHLTVSPLRAGYVHELTMKGFAAADGTPLLHPEAYYTLVEIPRGGKARIAAATGR